MMKTEFQKFSIKLAALSIPILIWIAWQCCLPLNQYTFRGWEGIISGKGWNAGFYPDQQLEMTEVGDLGPYTLNAVPHAVAWNTDHLGYRNQEPVCSDPEFTVIGDSFAMGAGLTQADTLTGQLTRDSGKCARSFAGGKLHASANQIFAEGLQPRYLVIVLAERNTGVLRELISYNEKHRIQWLNYLPHRLLTRWSHFRKGFYSNYRASHGVIAALTRTFTPVDEAVALYAPRVSDPHAPQPQLLYFGNIGNSEEGPDQLRPLHEILEKFSDQISTHGTRLIVTFVPNKESVYYELVGKLEPKLGDRLRESLKSQRYLYLDLISRFKESYQRDHQLLHRSDDTHWNERGVKLLSEMIVGATRR